MSGLFRYNNNTISNGSTSTPNQSPFKSNPSSMFGNSPVNRDWYLDGESPQSFNHCQTGASPNNLKSVNELEKQLTSLQNQNFNLKLKIYFLEEQKTQPNEGERELTKQIVNLKVQVANLMKENREKTDAVTQASRTLTYLENQQKTLEQEHCVAVECFKETIKRLEDELKKQHRDMYVRDFCDKASETGTCDEDVAKMINQVDSYARLDDMMRTKEEHEQLIQELQCTTETLKDEIQKITCSKSDLEIELENIKANFFEEKKMRTDLLCENEELQNKTKEHEVGIQTAAKAIDRIVKENKCLKVELKKLKNSEIISSTDEAERIEKETLKATRKIDNSINSTGSNDCKNTEIEYLREEIKKIMDEKNTEIVELKCKLAQKEAESPEKQPVTSFGTTLSAKTFEDCSDFSDREEENKKHEQLIHCMEEKVKEAETKRCQTVEFCSILKLRLEELAGFLNTLLQHRDVLGHLCGERLCAMKKAVDKSLHMSTSQNSVMFDASNVNTFTSFLSESMSCLDKALNISDDMCESLGQNMVETLREEIRCLRCELDKCYKKKETNKERKSLPNRFAARSGSEEWSEPDRCVSQQRIGLEVVQKQCKGGLTSSDDETGAFSSKNPSILEKVNKLEKEITCRDNKLLQVELTLVEMETALKEEKLTVIEVRKDFNSMKHINDLLECEIKCIKQKLRDSKVEIDVLKEQAIYMCKTHEKSLRHAVEKERERLCKEIEELNCCHQKEMDCKEQELEQLKQDLCCCQEQLDCRTCELEQTRKRLDDAQCLIDEFQEKETQLRSDICDLEDRVKNLQKCYDESTLQASKASIERSKSVNEKVAVLEELKDLAAKYDCLKEERCNLKDRLRDMDSLNEELKDLAAKYDCLKEERCNLKDRLREMDSLNAQLCDKLKMSCCEPEPRRRDNDAVSGYGSEENQAANCCPQLEPPIHDCEKVECENQELKRRLAHTKRTLEHTFNKLKTSNQLKEKVERDIQKQLVKTNNVLKIARNNIENRP